MRGTKLGCCDLECPFFFLDSFLKLFSFIFLNEVVVCEVRSSLRWEAAFCRLTRAGDFGSGTLGCTNESSDTAAVLMVALAYNRSAASTETNENAISQLLIIN